MIMAPFVFIPLALVMIEPLSVETVCANAGVAMAALASAIAVEPTTVPMSRVVVLVIRSISVM